MPRQRRRPPTRDARNRYLMKRYGINIKEYDLLLEAQDGVCFICQKPPKTLRLSVDHDHWREKAVGKRPSVRGLLCWRCNRGLQVYRDDPEALERAALYLRKPPAQGVLTSRASG